MFAQMCNETHGEYLWGPPSCLEMLTHFNFIFPVCYSLSEQPQMLPGEQKEKKKFSFGKFVFESSRKSRIVRLSQESGIGMCRI